MAQHNDAVLEKPPVARETASVGASKPPTTALVAQILKDEADNRMSAARGIVIAVLISLPLWALLGFLISVVS